MHEHLRNPYELETTQTHETATPPPETRRVSRRLFLQAGAVGSAGAALTVAGAFGRPYLAQQGLHGMRSAGRVGEVAESELLGDLRWGEQVDGGVGHDGVLA